MSALNDFKIDFITSADGAKIGYRKIGAGPGLILVHGGLQSSLNFTCLARALSADFTVYVPDRRGRGLSGAYGGRYSLITEANDLLALARHTNTGNIFGLSSGAIITLRAALTEPAIKKIVLYEPPIHPDGNMFKKLDTAYEDAMRKGNLGKAFIAILKATGDPEISFFSTLPAFITAPFVNMMIRAQLKSKADSEFPLHELVPTFHYDRIIVRESEPLMAQAKNIRANVLLLHGSKSQKYFTPVIDQLNALIPNARRVKFENLGHLGADNTGNPLKVAEELLKFFKEK